MKEALYYKKLKNKLVQCQLCPKYCIIEDGNNGNCKARGNRNGKLYSLVYGKPVSVNIDPVEKKPQFHFLPGTNAYSIGTAGCNLHCKFCQNWEISQCAPDEIPFIELPPEKVVEEALKSGCKSIAYTYNDPVVFIEYVIDTAKLAKKKGLKNIFVTNGYINQEPLREICKYMDAFHIDLKSFNDKFYKDICSGTLTPILETLKTLKTEKKHFEIIHLTILGFNDNEKELREMCKWIKEELGTDTVLHFSRFFPCYLMNDTPPTPEKTLIRAGEIATEAGINYVYIGNIILEGWENTYCPNCKELLIERKWFDVLKNKIKNGKCFNCRTKIAGIWE
jgi:pyruvate formate lyase activating enzyme